MKRNPPQAPPETISAPSAAQAELAPKTLVENKHGLLVQYQDGRLFLRAEQHEYFDGKKWRPWQSSVELVGAGIPYNGDDPRKRVREVNKPLSHEEARDWIMGHCIPFEFHASFAQPLAGKFGSVAGVGKAASSIGITPDALVCHAVEIYLRYLEEFPGEAKFFDIGNVQYIECRKWIPSQEAEALFRGLYEEALAAPLKAALMKLKALRDLVGSNSCYSEECEAISRMLGSAWSLSEMPWGKDAHAESRAA